MTEVIPLLFKLEVFSVRKILVGAGQAVAVLREQELRRSLLLDIRLQPRFSARQWRNHFIYPPSTSYILGPNFLDSERVIFFIYTVV